MTHLARYLPVLLLVAAAIILAAQPGHADPAPAPCGTPAATPVDNRNPNIARVVLYGPTGYYELWLNNNRLFDHSPYTGRWEVARFGDRDRLWLIDALQHPNH